MAENEGTWDQLKHRFVDDHRLMTRAYRDLIKSLDEEDFERVAQLADELDRHAGPHIEFEESHLYPRVRESRGDRYADTMYQQHGEILETIRELCDADFSVKPTANQVHRWQIGLQEGIDHAVTCGTLLSHLQALDPSVQEELLEESKRLRRRGRRWSELAA
ncbi:MAG: hemerythrin domain-containing protein [Planctomycetota bacterium]